MFTKYINNTIRIFAFLINKIFNKSNFIKFIFIFTIGFSTRVIINYIHNINVYTDYFYNISLIYYICLSVFLILTHEIVEYYQFNIIPSFFSHIYLNITNYIYDMLSNLNKSILSIRIYNRSLNSILRSLRLYIYNNNLKGKLENYFSYINSRDTFSYKYKMPKNIVDNTYYKANQDVSHRYARNTSISQRTFNSTVNRPKIYNQNTYARPEVYNQDTSINRIPLRRKSGNEDLYFVVNTVKSRDSLESRYLNTPESNIRNTNNYSRPLPIVILDRPVQSTLTTPSLSSIDGEEMFGKLPGSIRSSYERNPSHYVENVYDTNQGNNRNLQVKYSPHNVHVSYSNITPITRSNSGYNTVYSNSVYSQHDGTYSSLINNNNGNNYPLPGAAPYFYPTTNSININSAELNNINKAMLPQPEVKPEQIRANVNSVDWVEYRNLARTNINNTYVENERVANEKEVYIPHIITMPQEIELKPKGVKGKIKLAFNFIDSKVYKTVSNMESIAVKYHDVSKRKFFWTIWEKKHGVYESYEEFKSSWDPNTNIWKEITKRTHRDMQADIEGILGVKSRVNKLDYSKGKLVETSHNKPKVNKLNNSKGKWIETSSNKPSVSNESKHLPESNKSSSKHSNNKDTSSRHNKNSHSSNRDKDVSNINDSSRHHTSSRHRSSSCDGNNTSNGHRSSSRHYSSSRQHSSSRNHNSSRYDSHSGYNSSSRHYYKK